jgi:trk system potassium uptake protein TrkH
VRSSAWPTAGVAALAPLLALVAARLTGGADVETPFLVGLAAGLVLLVAGGLAGPRRPAIGRGLATSGVVSFLVSFLTSSSVSLALTLTSILGTVALLGALFGIESVEDARLSRRRLRELTLKRAQITSAAFLVEWVLVFGLDIAAGRVALLALAAGLALAWGFLAAWALRARRSGNPKWKWPLLAAVPIVFGISSSRPDWEAILSLGGLGPLVLLLLRHPREERDGPGQPWWRPIVDHAPRLLVTTFAVLCLIGTVLLALPASAASGRSIGVLDAAFTAVSAVCVTGLIVLDTPVAFSGFGEAVLLLLIQLGGIGIMSFSAVTFALFGLRPSFRHESAVAGLVGAESRGTLFDTVKRLVLFTLAVEAAGALAITSFFLHQGRSASEALWHGLFTAVSAFCNAGFSLASDSLVSHQEDPFVLHSVAALIVLGGLSPATCAALPGLLRRRPIAVEQKIALAATIFLLLGGAFIFLALEWGNTLGALSFWDRVHNAWFQSVTTRTAGFNSVDIAALRPATISLVIALMFVGGSPGGTAGGVKTTTAVVLLLAVVSAVRGRWTAAAFGRRLSHRTVYKAASILTVGALTLAFALFALQITQTMDPGVALFETVSALGTVGLSIGGTAELDGVGKILVMFCMFAGRVGPLSLFLFLGVRSSTQPWELVEEDVAVG